jgi:hypothetical protein
MLALQLALGISTLLLGVPVALGAMHQAGAMVLFALMLWTTHAVGHGAAEPQRHRGTENVYLRLHRSRQYPSFCCRTDSLAAVAFCRHSFCRSALCLCGGWFYQY